MAIKESALSLITSIAQGDWIRAVTSAGASRRVTVANLAKAIVESYTGSTLAGSSQSVKAAIDSLNSKTAMTAPFQMTYINNSYVSEESVKRCYAGKSGRIIALSMNLNLDKAVIPSGQEVVVGYFAGLHCSLACLQQVPHQSDPSKAMMMSFANTSNGIQVKACNYMSSGNLPAGFFRTTVTLFSADD